MRMDVNGRLFFKKGDRVRPRTVVRPNPDTGEPEATPHPQAYGGMKVDAQGEILERGMEDEVLAVCPWSEQIQLASWIRVATDHPQKHGSLRTRLESNDWYDAVAPVKQTKRGGADLPKAG